MWRRRGICCMLPEPSAGDGTPLLGQRDVIVTTLQVSEEDKDRFAT